MVSAVELTAVTAAKVAAEAQIFKVLADQPGQVDQDIMQAETAS
jgi:homoserine trans-succinylase